MVNFVACGNGTWKYSNPLFKTPLPSPDNLTKPISRGGIVAANRDSVHDGLYYRLKRGHMNASIMKRGLILADTLIAE